MDKFYIINIFYNLIGIYIIRKKIVKKKPKFIHSVRGSYNCSCRYNTFMIVNLHRSTICKHNILHCSIGIFYRSIYHWTPKWFSILLLQIYVSNLWIYSVVLRSACDLTNLFSPCSSDSQVVFDPTIITGFFLHFIFVRVQLPGVFSRRHICRERYMIIIIIYCVYSVICPHIIRVLKKIQYYIHNFCHRPTRITYTPIMRVDFHSQNTTHIAYRASYCDVFIFILITISHGVCIYNHYKIIIYLYTYIGYFIFYVIRRYIIFLFTYTYNIFTRVIALSIFNSWFRSNQIVSIPNLKFSKKTVYLQYNTRDIFYVWIADTINSSLAVYHEQLHRYNPG